MGVAEVDDHFLGIADVVEVVGEVAAGGEEELTADRVHRGSRRDAGLGVAPFLRPAGQVRQVQVEVIVLGGEARHRGQVLNPAREQQRRDDHPGEDADREVPGRDGEDDGHGHYRRLATWHPFQLGRLDALPVEGGVGDDEHHGDQGGHRDLRDDRVEADDEDQQEDAGEEGRDPGPCPRLHVDHRLADHRAAAHAAEERGDDVGDPLAPALAVLVGAGVGQVVDQARGHLSLEQADDRHRDRGKGDDREGVEAERDVR
jgi:hypothetical protein